MEWINYHHLLYFWTVARTGSIASAAQELLLSPPTISSQISRLEDQLGEKLFVRSGRRLVLTDAGQIAFRYAEEIFSLGRELTDTLHGRPTGHPLRLRVGVADPLPKWIAYHLIYPALQLPGPVRVICHEHRTDRLLAELAVNDLDLVLSDTPVGPQVKVRAFNHLLGECDVAFYCKRKLATKLRRRFPHSLDGIPFLLPTEDSSMRFILDQWFKQQQVRPLIVGEFDDFSLLRTFAEAGHGAFAAPAILDAEMRHYGFGLIGRTSAIRSHFYAISVERKIKNPAVVAISEAARQKIFG
ncbi:MAG TPA: transcriptional activator NhaR [Terriglobia bacterium]|nr:transcriptional activator NhaR [Terriglobia bacterium]HVB29414.1 transcriptional activator NhaR [Terriglobia bacterium]